ncbi:Crp/Fnr family transcriptional regulator [Campylobacter ureolyticus]|uniref:Transcriptional regulator, Crp/Fnr family n=1 Tax=Campylobacter ureolyticus TaxID=827 RepID=A0AAE7JPS7_9BACT|nr:helix-turn-helix domain-containing protein [Campylobacter ureolyticus]MCR8684325.1 helix-turn-helix domain-containing protein [Campylobacter ureolyticus]MCZ6105440.1 helix-turn-helix domain-containing protein [Campylobacter ureolyticus]MCZ6158322.1 helix-turn-helix domain-containing protein [Campylobacter ureolyticus]QKF84358.1 transcriptional regulator, Crp/Fnr family [Campylobacter ureolyticus]QQY35485.1 Crp/Fnr family transcriptional regulator [Campylobacter ureolyticus]
MIEFFKNSSLFAGIDENEIKKILNCIEYRVFVFDKNLYLYELSQGFKAMLLKDGIVDIISLEKREIIDDRLVAGDSLVYDFGKSDERFLRTKRKSTLISMDIGRIFDENKRNCQHKTIFMQNLIKDLNKFMSHLSFKLNIYSKTHLRDRILLFLNSEREKTGSNLIKPIFNQEDLAKYLSCNRSALSRELYLMEKEGIIKIKNREIWFNES